MTPGALSSEEHSLDRDPQPGPVVYLTSIFTIIMLAMFTCRLALPPRSFLLVGPRGAAY